MSPNYAEAIRRKEKLLKFRSKTVTKLCTSKKFAWDRLISIVSRGDREIKVALGALPLTSLSLLLAQAIKFKAILKKFMLPLGIYSKCFILYVIHLTNFHFLAEVTVSKFADWSDAEEEAIIGILKALDTPGNLISIFACVLTLDTCLRRLLRKR